MPEFLVDNRGIYLDNIPYINIYDFVEKKGEVEIWEVNTLKKFIKDFKFRLAYRNNLKDILEYINSNKNIIDLVIFNALLHICIKGHIEEGYLWRDYYLGIYYKLLRDFILVNKDVWLYRKDRRCTDVKLKISGFTNKIVYPLISDVLTHNECWWAPSNYDFILLGNTLEEALANSNTKQLREQVQRYIN